MQLPPVDVIAAWPQSNYTNPSEVRGPAILILTLIFVPLLLILVALRTYTRLRLSKNFGADDIAIVAAVFPTMGCAILTMIAVQNYGWSRHIWDVPLSQLELGLKYVIAIEILFSIGCSLTKLSMLLLILRVMAAGSKILRRLSITVMVVVLLEMFIFAIVVINTCSPVSDYYTLSFTPQKCINETAHILAGGIINSLTDFCVVLIPIPVVMRLRLPLRQRIYCALLFGAGFIVCFAGAFRIAYTYELNTTYDKTWLAYPTWISGTVELYLGIIATSIPAIKPFISRYFPRILSSTTSGQTFTTNNLNTLMPHHSHSGSRSKSPFSDPSYDSFSPRPSFSDDIYVTKSFAVDVEKALLPAPQIRPPPLTFPAKTKSRTLAPVISAFSTYKRPKSGAATGAAIANGSVNSPLPVQGTDPNSTKDATGAQGGEPGGGGLAAGTANSSKTTLSSFATVSVNELALPTGLAAPKHSQPQPQPQPHSQWTVAREVLVGKSGPSSPSQ